MRTGNCTRSIQTDGDVEDVTLDCPESPCLDGDTPLHAAAMIGRIDLLSALLPFVTDINVSGDLGNTPLHCAALWEHVDIALALLENGAEIARANEYGDTPLDFMRRSPVFDGFVLGYI